MDRRRFLLTWLAGIVAAAPRTVEGQQAGKVYRIGMISTFPFEHPEIRSLAGAFLQGMSELGYVPGQNLVLEPRSAHGRVEGLSALFAGLVSLRVDLIIIFGGTPAALVARRANVPIPAVAPAMGDPVSDGIVRSLAQPGGKITGSTFLGPALVPKRIELMKLTVPTLSRVAALWHPGAYGERTMEEMSSEAEAAARRLGVQLQRFEARSVNEFEAAFAAMGRERTRALLVMPSPMFYNEHKRITDLALKSRLPAIFAFREAAESGALMSYGASLTALFHHAATQVDKILRGANEVGTLPVEQPTTFELVINLKTAKALGLTIPPSLLARADQVIE